MEHPFSLERGPLFRARLVRILDDDHVLILNAHHVVTDGWSLGVLDRELSTLYRAKLASEDPPLEALPLQYADYALWQRRWLQGEALEGQLEYWQAELEGAPAALDLPIRGPRPPMQTFRGALVPFRLGEELTAALQAQAQATQSTLFLLLEGAFAELLARYGRASEVNIGIPVANRRFAELEPLIGFFVNTLVLRNRCGSDQTVEERLSAARQTLLGALAHQDLPFEKLVEVLNPVRDTSSTPLFQAMLVLQNTPAPPLDLEGIEVEPFPLDYWIAKFDLTLYAVEEEGAVRAGLEYNTDLFEEATIRRMAGHLTALLEGFSRRRGRRVRHIPMLLEAEREQLRGFAEPAPRRSAAAPGLHLYFHRQARQTPEASALICGPEELTYRELLERAERIRGCLPSPVPSGSGEEIRIAVLHDRQPDLIASLLAVLASGAVYVPLDPTYPKERLTFLLEDAEVSALLTSTGTLRGSELEIAESDDFPVIFTDRLPAGTARLPAPAAPHARQLAYLIYTSGSTGRPKAVAIAHGSASALVDWALSVYSREDLAGVLFATSVCFDLSVFEIFVTLASGGALILADDLFAAAELPDPERITLINTVPSAAQELLQSGAVPPRVRVRQPGRRTADRRARRRVLPAGFHRPGLRPLRSQ